MAINETVRDLDVNPNVTKTVTLDLQKIIPTDTEGDEIYVTSASTATSVISKIDGAALDPIFLREFKAGYAKSSGQANPPYTITSSGSQLQLSIDGSLFREITLTEGFGLSGDDVADDMQSKIAALGGSGGLEEGNLGFLNATVEFKNGRFRIVSGTVSNTYVGVGKSSVKVISGSLDASASLGFDIPVESETISTKRPTETKLVADYTAGGATLNVESVDDYSVGQAFTITDGSNREYFVASAISGATTEMTISGSGLANDYGTGSIVQKVFERDPDSELASPYEDIDALIRFQLRSLANQADFTS
jgi:hypothetical protein